VDTNLVLAASLTYLLATLVYGVYLLRFEDRLVSSGLALMGLGAAFSITALTMRLLEGHSIFSRYEGFLLLSCGLGVGYFGVSLRKRLPLAGAMIAPICTMLMYSLHVFQQEVGLELSKEIAVVTPIHITTSMIGFVALGLSAIASGIAVIQEYRLKKKRVLLSHSGRLPSLSSLERFSHRILVAGFPIYSVGLALGAVWFSRSTSMSVTRHLIMATFSWVLYALLVHARVAAGLRGRKASILTLAAFASALFVVFLSALRSGVA
jgi:ABC-type uncharacterized transport system permease subunit